MNGLLAAIKAFVQFTCLLLGVTNVVGLEHDGSVSLSFVLSSFLVRI